MTTLNNNQELQKIIKNAVDPDFVIELDNPYSSVSVRSFWVMLKSKAEVVRWLYTVRTIVVAKSSSKWLFSFSGTSWWNNNQR